MTLTIFTPTYNRKNTLGRLYDSLCAQTDKDFEWVVVDDGSSDDTEELIKGFIDEGKIDIRYCYQENKGKPAAHNKGVEMAEGELFTCVDSDDILYSDAVEKIIAARVHMGKNDIGIIAARVHMGKNDIGIIAAKYNTETSDTITKIKDKNVMHSTLKDLYDIYGMSGDTMLIYLSDVIKKYSFPIYDDEKFIPEGYLYDLLDREGTLYVLRESLYGCEYLPGGYTANMARLLYNNPQGYFTYINQRLRFDTDFKSRFLDSVRYVGMAVAHRKKRVIAEAVYPLSAVLAYIPGYLMYLQRYRRFAK